MVGLANIGRRLELYAFRFHLSQATINQVFIQLEVRNAVTQQPTYAIALFKDGDIVAGTCQLLRASQACGAGAHNGDALAAAAQGWLWYHPALFPAAINNGVLYGLDAHCVIIDV